MYASYSTPLILSDWAKTVAFPVCLCFSQDFCSLSLPSVSLLMFQWSLLAWQAMVHLPKKMSQWELKEEKCRIKGRKILIKLYNRHAIWKPDVTMHILAFRDSLGVMTVVFLVWLKDETDRLLTVPTISPTLLEIQSACIQFSLNYVYWVIVKPQLWLYFVWFARRTAIYLVYLCLLCSVFSLLVPSAWLFAEYGPKKMPIFQRGQVYISGPDNIVCYLQMTFV